MRSNDSKHPVYRIGVFSTSTRRRAWSAVFAVIALLAGGVAHGQNLERGQGVTDRRRPDYDAPGLRLGSFLLYPAAEAHAAYDDNIFASDNGKEDDAVFTLAPSLFLDSNWTQHAISIKVDSSSALYASHGNESRTDWGVAGAGRLDLFESSNITTSIGYRNLTEGRQSTNSLQNLAEPTEYDQFDASGAWNYSLNRISASLGGGFTRLNYDDTPRRGSTTADLDFRDRDIARGVARLSYSFEGDDNAFVQGGHSAFVQAVVSDRDYRKLATTNPVKRDSFGYEIVAGWASEISNLVAGEVYVGYLDRDYDSSTFDDVSDFTAGLDLEWYVTEIFTVRAKASRGVPDSTVDDVGGILRSAVALGFDWELMPNVLVHADVHYEKNNFKGSSRDDDWVGTGVGVKYLVNRYLHLDLEYGFDERASDDSGFDFQRNRVSFGFRLQR